MWHAWETRKGVHGFGGKGWRKETIRMTEA
jgi:hypothetical protein